MKKQSIGYFVLARDWCGSLLHECGSELELLQRHKQQGKA